MLSKNTKVPLDVLLPGFKENWFDELTTDDIADLKEGVKVIEKIREELEENARVDRNHLTKIHFTI